MARIAATSAVDPPFTAVSAGGVGGSRVFDARSPVRRSPSGTRTIDTSRFLTPSATDE